MAPTSARWLRLFGIEPNISANHQAWLHLDPDDPLDPEDQQRLGGSDPVISVSRPALRDASQVFLTTEDGQAHMVTASGALAVAEVGLPA